MSTECLHSKPQLLVEMFMTSQEIALKAVALDQRVSLEGKSQNFYPKTRSFTVATGASAAMPPSRRQRYQILIMAFFFSNVSHIFVTAWLIFDKTCFISKTAWLIFDMHA